MASAPALNKIERAHQMYREGRYDEALGFYTEALSMAKSKAQKIALHSNRAACFLKLHDFKKAADECTSVLELDHKHTGALMLRAQTLVTLKEYQFALFDVSRLIELNPSSEVYQNLQARLKTQLSLAPIPEAETEMEEEEEDEIEEELATTKEKEVHEVHERINVTDAAGRSQENEPQTVCSRPEVSITETQPNEKSSDQQSSRWQVIPKPKGHSRLDYSRWDKVETDSSEDDSDDEDDEESLPQYRFRVKTVGVRPVK